MKLKCSFTESGEEVLAYVSGKPYFVTDLVFFSTVFYYIFTKCFIIFLSFFLACGLYISNEFSLTPVNPLPIIQTALARNLEENLSLSDTNQNFKSG